MHRQTHTGQRFVDLHELACGACRDGVDDGPDGFTHGDGSQLCSPEPVEVTR